MPFPNLFNIRWLGVPYTPHPAERSFIARMQSQEDAEVVVEAAVLDGRESDTCFGVPLARHGLQPVWLRISNRGQKTFRLRLAGIDPNYYPPLEAAYACHYRTGRRLLEFGLLAWLFFPLIFLLPFKLLAGRAANRRMNAYFVEQGIGWGIIRPGSQIEGFVYTTLDEGSKQFIVKLIGLSGAKNFPFAIPIPGLRVDHHGKELEADPNQEPLIECDEAELRQRLSAAASSTTNRHETLHGDPLNLVVIGDFDTIISGFGAGWDETEVISMKSCIRTAKAFLIGTRYRYSPVSPLFYAKRSQDFALQRIRETINERLHLRLWRTPLRFGGKPVWIGQVSRDIGVRFTLKTWNLTTHKIDPDVDDSRDYILDTLIESGRVAKVGFVEGVSAAPRTAPRHNLTGDPYFTDGLRAVAVFSETRTEPALLDWK